MQVGHARDECVEVAVGEEAVRPALVHVQKAPQIVRLVALALALLAERLLKRAEHVRNAHLRLHSARQAGDRSRTAYATLWLSDTQQPAGRTVRWP